MCEELFEKYCCNDCRYLKYPFEVDELGVPKPTNPYCTKGKDKDFPKVQSKYLDWINHAEYEKHICDSFKLNWMIRLHLRKTFKEEQKLKNNSSEDLFMAKNILRSSRPRCGNRISQPISEDEIMSLRYENTKLKLVLKDIIEDLEREAERGEPIIIRQEYVEWIKDNVDLRLNGEKELRL